MDRAGWNQQADRLERDKLLKNNRDDRNAAKVVVGFTDGACLGCVIFQVVVGLDQAEQKRECAGAEEKIGPTPECVASSHGPGAKLAYVA
jgi:hypothetical protein